MVITKIEVFKDGKVDFTVDKPCSVRILPLQPVWLVLREDFEYENYCDEVMAVCSSEEKANRYAEILNCENSEGFYVEKREMDKDINGQSLD